MNGENEEGKKGERIDWGNEEGKRRGNEWWE
jgi:hypothetical protein